MNNLVIITVLVLVVLYYRITIAGADHHLLKPIEYKDLKTGDIWLGRYDFSNRPDLWHAHAFFAVHDAMLGRRFSHCGVIYRDPTAFRDRGPEGLYVFMTQSVPYEKDEPISQKPYGGVGSFLVPIEVVMHQYRYNAITPIARAVPDDLFRAVMEKNNTLHEHLADSAWDYTLIAPAYITSAPLKLTNKSVCTDHVSWILRDCGVVNINRPVVWPSDLYSDGTPSWDWIHFGDGQKFLKTRRVGYQ